MSCRIPYVKRGSASATSVGCPRPLRKLTPAPLILLAACVTCVPSLVAQSAPRRLIREAISPRQLVVLRGNTPPVARPENDRGAAPAALPLDRLLLLLKRAPQQAADLKAFLAQQQDAASPDFHRWLTPEQYGERFGLDPADLATVVGWLKARGFAVNRVARGGNVIEFSGTAAEVSGAFHTEIHRYAAQGREQWANNADPAIPAALSPAVAGVVSLNNIPRRPLHFSRVGRWSGAANNGLRAAYTGPDCEYGCEFVAPYDLATIYNLLPLWKAGIDGTGETVAVVSQSDINPQDDANFRSQLDLPAPHLNVIYDGPNPGKLESTGDESESDLDVEWAGATAPGATVDLVVSASTNSTAGVDLSAEYIVDNDLASVLSESYGACELVLGTTGNQFENELWQQAAAEGISVYVAAGDGGSAACDANAEAASYGLSVSGEASPPNAVAVGGTDFDEFTDPTNPNFWSYSNSATKATALGYIPETTWNDSCTNADVDAGGAPAACNNEQVLSSLAVVGGGGGLSNCTTYDGQDAAKCSGGYAAPSWQIQGYGTRALPDVALFAGNGFAGAAYVMCDSDDTSAPYCQFPFSGGSAVDEVGGTSVAAQVWAGLQLLVNQKTGSAQGDPHYVLHHLAADENDFACNASTSPAASCVFYDVTKGTIAMPCSVGTQDCDSLGPGDTVGILSGYAAQVGYDLATGLGTPNAANLVNAWAAVSFQPSAATLKLNPDTNLTHGASVAVAATVAAQNGGATPTGFISLLTSAGVDVADFPLINGAVAASTSDLPGGTYAVHAHYPGDGVFAPSDSAPISLTVAPEASTTTESVFTTDTNGNFYSATSIPFGGAIYLSTAVKGASGQGTPTGNVTITDNGSPLAGGPFALNVQGEATDAAPPLKIGTHSLVAQYPGDGSFGASTSSATVLTITRVATTTTAGGPQSAVTGTSLVFSVSVAATGTVLPTGTVTLYDDGTAVGSPASLAGGDLGGDSVSTFGTINIEASALPLGNSVVNVGYSGDANYAPSASLPQNVDIQVPTTLTLTSVPANPNQGESVTLTATVSASQARGQIGGTVQFNAEIPDGQANVPVTNGAAQFTLASLPPGQQNYISATYSGDGEYAGSQSALNVPVIPDFSIVPASSSLTITAPGQSAADALAVTFRSGYSGQVTFSCSAAYGMPSESSCSVSPTSLTASGSVTLKIATTAPSADPWLGWPGGRPPRGLAWFAALAFLLALWTARRRPARRRRLAALGLPLLLALSCIACGGGGGGGSGGSGGGGIGAGPSDPGTPIGSTQLLITGTAANGVTNSATVMMNVQ